MARWTTRWKPLVGVGSVALSATKAPSSLSRYCFTEARSSSRLTPQAVITFDACSSSISAMSRCSRVAYSCRRRLASPNALWRVCSSSRAKLGIYVDTPRPPKGRRASLTNVIRSASAIKGRWRAFPQIIASAAVRKRPLALLEQLFRRRAVRLNLGDVGFDARDFRLQHLDALLELLDRDRVEVLLAQGDQRIVGLARKEFVEVHRVNR